MATIEQSLVEQNLINAVGVRNNAEIAYPYYFTLNEVTHRLPRRNGKRLNTSTIWRWISKGCHGIFLEHWRMGRTVVTTEAALQKFFTELAKADSAQVQQPHFKHPKQKRRQAPEHRQKSIDEANAILRRAKIIV